MRARVLPLFLLAILVAVLTCTGCTMPAIGDVRYEGGNYSVAIDNSGQLSGAYLQVTAFRLSGWSQEEYSVVYQPLTGGPGHTVVTIPAELVPGRYRLFVYLLRDGTRETAVIRDIEV